VERGERKSVESVEREQRGRVEAAAHIIVCFAFVRVRVLFSLYMARKSVSVDGNSVSVARSWLRRRGAGAADLTAESEEGRAGNRIARSETRRAVWEIWNSHERRERNWINRFWTRLGGLQFRPWNCRLKCSRAAGISGTICWRWYELFHN
jgi:hypothetical protein